MGVTTYVRTPNPLQFGELATTALYEMKGVLNVQGGNLSFGVGAANSTTQGEVVLPTASINTLARFAGVVLRKRGRLDQSVEALLDDEYGDLLTKGEVVVKIDQDVDPTLPVFWRYRAATGSGTGPYADEVGSFRADADTADAVDISSVARWVSNSTAAVGTAVLKLNLP